MPKSGTSNDTLGNIEDRIAEIITARDALLDLEIFVRGQYRRGHIDHAEAERLIRQIDAIVIGLSRGQAFGKVVRGNPEIL